MTRDELRMIGRAIRDARTDGYNCHPEALRLIKQSIAEGIENGLPLDYPAPAIREFFFITEQRR